MKLKKSVLCLTLILMIGLITFGVSKDAKAQIYYGEYCWEFSSGEDTTGTIQLGLLMFGNWHFTVSGVVSLSKPAGYQFPAYGNLELVGSDWVLTLTIPGSRDGKLGIDNYKATLDWSLNGISEWIGVYQGATEYGTGTIALTACE